MTEDFKIAYQGWGGDANPMDQPQAQNDIDTSTGFQLYDKPGIEPGTGDYNWFYGNGQLEISAEHGHDELAEHAGVQVNQPGPSALGRVEVEQGRAHWLVSGNIALKGLAKQLKDYTKHVGWRWGGLASLDGNPISDEFMPKKAMYFYGNDDNVSILADIKHCHVPTKRIVLQGKTATVESDTIPEGVRQWIKDAGYKLAEYPGGGNMNDMIKNHSPLGEDLEMYDMGAQSVKDMTATPDDDGWLHYDGKRFKTYEEYLKYKADLTKNLDTPVENSGQFPLAPDMDKPLPNNHTDRQPFIDPVSSVQVQSRHEAAKVDGFGRYASAWDFDTDKNRYYVAYSGEKPVGYTVMEDDGTLVMSHVLEAYQRQGHGSNMIEAVKADYSVVRTGILTSMGEGLAKKNGFVKGPDGVWEASAWSFKIAAPMPKDMIQAPIPFIFDIDKDEIVIGQPGSHTSDVPGEFTPGGIVEGEYNPGGKVTVSTSTNMPWTVRHFVDLWYWSYPQMEVKGVELVDIDGKKTKLAGSAIISSMDVGHYLRRLAMADPAVDRSYKALADAGGKVYVVGGAVRDALLQKQPKDIDLMVAGLPEEVVAHVLSKLDGNVDLTGKSFGVYRYRVAGHEVEIALPRTEKSTGDKRTDFDFKVDHELPVEADLERRDFTANAMAVSLDDGKLIDPFEGAKDIEDKKLQTVHPDSFKEDPTRLVRALVASSRHGLAPTEQTRMQMDENAHRLGLESPDRIGAEMDKLMRSSNPAGAIRLAKETGMLKHLIPELHNHFDFDQNNPHHNHTLGQHTLSVLEGVQDASDDPDLRMAALFHDLGKPKSAWRNPDTGFNHYYRGPQGQGDNHEDVGVEIAGNRLNALRWPKKRTQYVQHIIQHHMFPAFDSERGARRFINKVGDEHADDLMTFRHADQYGKGTDEYQDTKTPVAIMRGHVQSVRNAGSATGQADLAITGRDIMQHLGIPPGPAVGQALQRATEKVLEDPTFNNRNDLLNYLSDGPT